MAHYLHRSLVFILCLLASSSFCQNAYITNRGDSTVSVINTLTHITVATIPVKPNPSGVVISPDGTRVYISYYNLAENSVTAINTITNEVIGETRLLVSSTYGGVIDISPDGTKLYVACRDTVFVMNAVTLAITARIATEKGNSIQGIAVSTDGLNVYVNGYHKIIVIDAMTNLVSGIIPVKDAFFLQLAISPDNAKLYGADKLSGYLHVINLISDSVTDIKVAPQNTNCVCVSPDGKRVYTSNYKDGSVSVVDGVANTLITTITVGDVDPFGISLTPDGSRLYVADFSANNVSVINTSTYEITDTISVGKNPAALGKFIGGNSSILPVILTSFTASPDNRNVTLQWQLGSEAKLSSFSVQRSNDGIHFTTIGNVFASNDDTQQWYSYTDETACNLPGITTLYYRLQMTDKNGNVSTSATAIASLSSSKNILASFSPNPVKDRLTVRLTHYNGNATIAIYDMAGKQYYAERRSISDGGSVNIYTSALPAGIYILHITAGKDWKQKFIKE